MRMVWLALAGAVFQTGCSTERVESISPELQAASAPVTPLQAFVNNPNHRDAVLQTAKQGWLRYGCPFGNLRTLPGVAGPAPSLNTAGAQSAFLREGVIATGCGRARLLNVRTLINTATAQEVLGLDAPGQSRADYRLQVDTMLYVTQALTARQALCGDLYIDDTTVAVPQKTGAPKSPWSEDWLIYSCHKLNTVRVDYIPNARDTVVAVNASEISVGIDRIHP